MERLTQWDKFYNRYQVEIDGVKHFGSITDRLAEYEDTGLTPGEIKALAKQKDQMLADMATLVTALNEYIEAEEQGLLIKRDCNGCISDDCYECARCGKYEDHYVSEVALKGCEVQR